MNVERLLETLNFVQAEERKAAIQQRLQELQTAFGNLQSQPQNPSFQNEVSQRLNALETALKSVFDTLTPAQAGMLDQIGALRFVSPKLAADIRVQMAQNGMTPNVMFQQVSQLISQRQPYLQNIEAARNGLNALGVKVSELRPGEAEIGFLLPRTLFENHFDQFIDQQRAINRIIRIFSEMVTGQVEPIVVRQISSTDPILFFGLNPVTIAEIGAAVTSALAVWKLVLEIKKLYAEAVRMKLSEKFTGGLEAEIKQKIESAIKDKVQELEARIAPAVKDDPKRKNELTNGLHWALESIFARIERGMTVEVRFVPPLQAQAGGKADTKDKPSAMPPVFAELNSVAQKLEFPAPLPKPILALPSTEPPVLRERKHGGGAAE